jgi:hypothetical protein
MATAPATHPGLVSDAASQRPRMGRGADLVAVACATWMMVGLFLDGWAHSNIVDELESFFTPWHAVFYSGFTATAAWILYQVWRLQSPTGRFDARRVPAGYGLGLVGLVVFAVGGVGDALWHSIFGIEADIEALLSPTHLLLFSGTVLVLSSPWRAAWHSDVPAVQGWRGLMPALSSMTLTTAMVAFFFSYLSPFTEFWSTENYASWVSSMGGVGSDLGELSIGLGIAAHLWTTLVLVTPLVLALQRWRLPFGAVTVLFTVVALGLSAMEALDGAEMVLSALVGGIGTDLAIRILAVPPIRPAAVRGLAAAVRGLAALVPVLLWTTNFAIVDIVWGLGWSVELWAGTVCLCALSALSLAYLVTAPPLAASTEPR